MALNDVMAHFLMVEDDEDQAYLVKRSMKKEGLINTLDHVWNGEEAILYLNQEYPFENAKRPDVILLDLNLPKISGHEVLEIIKKDQNLKRIPVVVLTTSSADIDRAKAYECFANSYIVKPLNGSRFRDIIAQLGLYWAAVNCPPPFDL